MSWNDLYLRIRALFLPNRMEDDLGDEIDNHLELQIRKHRQAGASLAQAKTLTRRDFGMLESVKEQCRDERRVRWLVDLKRDFDYALRMLRRTPGFSALIVFILAMGIGANVSIFSVMDALLLRSLPVRDPGALFRTVRAVGSGDDTGVTVSYRVFQAMRERTRSLSDLMAYQAANEQAVSIDQADAMPLRHQVVSGNYFSVLGVKPNFGRLIASEDDGKPGQSPVAVISDRLWKSKFDQSPKAIGKTIRVVDRTFSIVGVAPSRFFGVEVGKTVDIWTPVSMAPLEYLQNDQQSWLQTMGRLRPGVGISQAMAPIQAVMNETLLEDVHQHAPPGTPKSVIDQFLAGMRIKGVPAGGGVSYLRRQYEQPLQLMLGLVIVVLLIASTNAANLMLAKGSARRQEIAIRLSLGAGPKRILQQLTVESVLLGITSAVLGLLIAHWATQVLVRMLTPANEPAELAVGLDLRLLAFTVSIAFIAIIVSGLLPSIRVAKVDTFASLRSGTGQSRPVARSGQKVLVASQIALSLVLVVGAFLLSRTLFNLLSSQLGFNPTKVLVASVHLPHPGDEKTIFPVAWSELLRRTRALPGVEAASLSSAALFEATPPLIGIRMNAAQVTPADPVTAILFVSPRYFKTLDISVLKGRDFEGTDNQSDVPTTVVVNQAFVSKFLRREDPIGRKLTKMADSPRWTEIVGVVGDAKFANLRDAAPPIIYLPWGHMPAWIHPQGHPGFAMSLQVRSRHTQASMANELRREGGPQVTVGAVSEQQQIIDDTLVRERLLAGVAGVLGAFSLLIAAFGLYGIMNYSVVQRRQEIGIRIALGAGPIRILNLLLRESLTIVLIGIFVGGALAIAGTQLMKTLLYGLTPNDPAAFVTATLVLLTASLVAVLIPAAKAVGTDPMSTLRNE